MQHSEIIDTGRDTIHIGSSNCTSVVRGETFVASPSWRLRRLLQDEFNALNPIVRG